MRRRWKFTTTEIRLGYLFYLIFIRYHLRVFITAEFRASSKPNNNVWVGNEDSTAHTLSHLALT